MRIEHKKTGSFVAIDDQGNRYTVEIITRFETYHGSEGTKTVPGTVALQLEDGTPVNRIDKGKYQTLDGLDLTSTDPNAP